MVDKTGETTLQAFVRMLHEAHGASEAVDGFDSRSEDSVSLAKWKELQAREREAFRALHELCRRVPVEDLMDHDDL